MNEYRRLGFTLIEFIITMSLAALLIFVAVPGFYGIFQNNKVVSMTNKLTSTFNFAKTEAIRQGISVSVCPAANAAFSACGGAGDWVRGWIVFTDADGNNQIDAPTDLLKVHEPLPGGTTAVANRDRVTYNGSGFVTSSNFTLTLSASGCYGNNSRVISITPSGRLAITYASC